MIYAIIGPTASGKSSLAEKISLKKNVPIINFDAFQVYKEMNIGTDKPSKDLLNSGRYFLYDFVPLDINYDIKNYQEDGRKLLDSLKGDTILVGGSGLYLKSLLFDYKFYDEPLMDESFKKDLTNEELYQELSKIDLEDAKKIGINNRKRLLRALYIFEVHKVNKTELNNEGKNKLLYKDVVFIGLSPERKILYNRIDERVDDMFDKSLKDEAFNLLNRYTSSARGLQAIGYKEFNLGLSDDLVKELIKKNTKNYAKRQITFFKHQFENVNWFLNSDDAMDFILSR